MAEIDSDWRQIEYENQPLIGRWIHRVKMAAPKLLVWWMLVLGASLIGGILWLSCSMTGGPKDDVPRGWEANGPLALLEEAYEATGISVGYISVPSTSIGESLAKELVEKRLAGCVQIIPSMTSMYLWQGELQRSQEALLTLKSRVGLEPIIEAFVKTVHPYTVPEVVFTSIQHGLDLYIEYIRNNTLNDDEAAVFAKRLGITHKRQPRRPPPPPPMHNGGMRHPGSPPGMPSMDHHGPPPPPPGMPSHVHAHKHEHDEEESRVRVRGRRTASEPPSEEVEGLLAFASEDFGVSLNLGGPKGGQNSTFKASTKVGEPLVMSVEGQPSTGYLWQVDPSDTSSSLDVSIQKVENTDISNADRRIVGGMELYRVVVRGEKTGEQKLKLRYVRPWEPAKIEATKVVEINVLS